MARETGVSGRSARRICKKVLQGGEPDCHHSPFELVLLTISVIVTIRWDSATGRIRLASVTCVEGARGGDRLLKRLSGSGGDAPGLLNPGCDNLSARAEAPKKKGGSECVRRATSGRVDAGLRGSTPHTMGRPRVGGGQ